MTDEEVFGITNAFVTAYLNKNDDALAMMSQQLSDLPPAEVGRVIASMVITIAGLVHVTSMDPVSWWRDYCTETYKDQ